MRFLTPILHPLSIRSGPSRVTPANLHQQLSHLTSYASINCSIAQNLFIYALAIGCRREATISLPPNR